MEILKKNLFPAHLIERVVNRYITGTLSNHCPRGSLPTSPIFYFKLPHIGHFSVVTQKKIRHFIKRYCNDLDIKLVFSSFKIGNMFGVKDPILGGLRSRVVYKFACAGCNACYVGETARDFSTRVREHLVSDRASHVFKHLQNSRGTQWRCSAKYLFRRGNSAGWEINYCRRLQLGISHFSKISSRAGWIVQKTRGDWEHTLVHTSCKKHILLRPLDKVIAFVENTGRLPAVFPPV